MVGLNYIDELTSLLIWLVIPLALINMITYYAQRDKDKELRVKTSMIMTIITALLLIHQHLYGVRLFASPIEKFIITVIGSHLSAEAGLGIMGLLVYSIYVLIFTFGIRYIKYKYKIDNMPIYISLMNSLIMTFVFFLNLFAMYATI